MQSYSSTVSFGAGSYLSAHRDAITASTAALNPSDAAELKQQQHQQQQHALYTNERCPIPDYMRLDFNPIVESLNFVSNNPYEVSLGQAAADNFASATTGSAWSSDVRTSSSSTVSPMDIDVGGLKSRLDYRSNDPCSRLNICAGDDYRGLTANIPSAHSLFTPAVRSLNNPVNIRSGLDSGPFSALHTSREQTLSAAAAVSNACLPGFDALNYASLANGRAYDPKILFQNPHSHLNGTNNGSSGLNLTRPLAGLLHHRSLDRLANHNSSNGNNNTTATQELAVAATEASLSNSIMMTPDSSTGFPGHNKFAASSDDGEVSPTPTNSSSCPQTSNRGRKAAPTLATGRRNLKGEPVDPDEADRRMKRRERNRRSAQKCRERKVQRTHELQAQVECLQVEINRLTQERDSLRTEARQFVSLLQLHCPGVSIPYMSCLSEVPEAISLRQQQQQRMVSQSPGPLKPELASDGWGGKTNGRVKTSGPLASPDHTTDPFTHPTTMMEALQNQSSPPIRSKSLFTFTSSSENNTSGLATDSEGPRGHTHPSGLSRLDNRDRVASALANGGPASAGSSTSSSSSGYDLSSFPVMDAPSTQPASVGNHHLEAAIDMAASANRKAAHSNDRTSNRMVTSKHKASDGTNRPMVADPSYVKCEDWDSPSQRYMISKSASNPLSPAVTNNTSTHLSVYVGSVDLINGTSTGRCDSFPQTEQQQQRANCSVENTCFS